MSFTCKSEGFFHVLCNLSTVTFLLQINTCNGFYCDQFTPNSDKKPKMWTENWTGW